MVEKEKSLKEQNEAKLLAFLIINLSILIYVRFNIEQSIGFISLPIAVHIINGLIDSNYKPMLVFWRIKCPLPGCRAFTELIQNDSRINIESLKRKFGE